MKRITPRLHMSSGGAAAPSADLSRSSGAMYTTVPPICPRASATGSPATDASPKSATLTADPAAGDTWRRFSGLRSRWTSPRSWMCLSARPTCRTTLAASSSEYGPRSTSLSKTSPPDASSSTSAYAFGSSNASTRETRCSCEPAARRSSHSFSASTASVSSLKISFSANASPSDRRTTRVTVANEPSPSICPTS